MMILPDQRLVILLPWKTGSQTLRARLGYANRSAYPSFFHYNPILRRVLHQHITLPDFLSLPEAQQGYRIAVFVRNPYDRVVSGFLQIQKDFLRQPERQFDTPWVKDLVMDQLRECQAMVERCGQDVSTWIEHLPNHYIREIGRNTSLYLHPCSYWTHIGGKRIAHFIGKVESFEVDFATLCQEYGIASANMVSTNISQNLDNRMSAEGCRYQHYLSDRALLRIETLFQEDFDLLGYQKLKRTETQS